MMIGVNFAAALTDSVNPALTTSDKNKQPRVVVKTAADPRQGMADREAENLDKMTENTFASVI